MEQHAPLMNVDNRGMYSTNTASERQDEVFPKEEAFPPLFVLRSAKGVRSSDHVQVAVGSSRLMPRVGLPMVGGVEPMAPRGECSHADEY